MESGHLVENWDGQYTYMCPRNSNNIKVDIILIFSYWTNWEWSLHIACRFISTSRPTSAEAAQSDLLTPQWIPQGEIH